MVKPLTNSTTQFTPEIRDHLADMTNILKFNLYPNKAKCYNNVFSENHIDQLHMDSLTHPICKLLTLDFILCWY